MSDEKDPKSPATTSDAYDRMAPRWHLISTLLGGTEAMRGAGEAYLPMHPEETTKGYQQRIGGAVLLNMVQQTLDNLSGKPFKDPIKPNEDVPEGLATTMFDDVDLQGNNLHVFSRQWFEEGLAKAFAHVLIDMPRPAPREDGQPRTLDDDRKQGVRPYWVMICPENVLFARAEIIDGVEVLQHIRIMEYYTEQDGFAEVCKQRIRVLEPGLVQIWVPKKKGKDKEEWALEDEWQTGLDYIPLVTFYAAREGFMEGKPPLMDLAQLNVTHWQSTADQRHILTVARFPILACSGASADESDRVVVGPNQILYNSDPNGKFYYVEHAGTAIEAGMKDLEMLERQMSGYGAEFLKKKPGNETATGRALDSAEATSDLSSMAGVFEDAIAQCLDITADWMRLGSSGGTVEVLKEYEVAEENASAIEFIKYLREKNDLSRKAIIEQAKLMGILPEDFDEEADWEQIKQEIEDRTGLLAESGLDLDPNAPPDNKNKPGEEKDDEDKDKGTKPGKETEK